MIMSVSNKSVLRMILDANKSVKGEDMVEVLRYFFAVRGEPGYIIFSGQLYYEDEHYGYSIIFCDDDCGGDFVCPEWSGDRSNQRLACYFHQEIRWHRSKL